MAKCCNTQKNFGIRMEESEGRIWKGTWAFPIKESVACKENYDKNTINGIIQFEPSYPGCPYCEAPSIFLCGNCNKVACFDGRTELVTCPTCNKRGRLDGQIDHLNAGGDR